MEDEMMHVLMLISCSVVENPEHCDMAHLRQLLMMECLHELGDIAHHHHYHDYRLRLLQAQGRQDVLMKCDEEYDTHIEGMSKNLAKEMSEREENMRKQFVDMVQNTEDDLKRREQEVKDIFISVHHEADILCDMSFAAPTQTRSYDERIGGTTAPNRRIRTRLERQVENTVSFMYRHDVYLHVIKTSSFLRFG